MGQCYDVEFKPIIKDEAGFIAALQNKIKTDKNVSYQTHWGDMNTVDGLMKIFLTHDVENNDGVYSCGFDASYGWESVMEEMFECVLSYIKDDSYIKIYPDSGVIHMYVKHGKCFTVDNPFEGKEEEIADYIFHSKGNEVTYEDIASAMKIDDEDYWTHIDELGSDVTYWLEENHEEIWDYEDGCFYLTD